MKLLTVVKAGYCLVLVVASIITIIATLVMDKSENSNMSIINGLTPMMQNSAKNGKKNTLDKVVTICGAVILGSIIAAYIYSALGV